jgi:DNA-binding NtrC family response regulator
VPELGGRVLVVSDDAAHASTLVAALTADGYEVDAVLDVASGCERLRIGGPEVVVADFAAPDFSVLAVLRCAARAEPPARVVCRFVDGGRVTERTELAIREAAYAWLDARAGAAEVLLAIREAVAARHALDGWTAASMQTAGQTFA